MITRVLTTYGILQSRTHTATGLSVDICRNGSPYGCAIRQAPAGAN